MLLVELSRRFSPAKRGRRESSSFFYSQLYFGLCYPSLTFFEQRCIFLIAY